MRMTCYSTRRSESIISNLLSSSPELFAIYPTEFQLTPSLVLNSVSQSKAKGISPQVFSERVSKLGDNDHANSQKIIAKLYEGYMKQLKLTNSLDFDDLLVYGVRLLRQNPGVVRGLRHVLVDEL